MRYDINDTVKGVTTAQSTPAKTEVQGRVVGIDPRPPRHQRTGFMYYVVKLEGTTGYVYIQSEIKENDDNKVVCNKG